ncbi:unnamed protein product, partial [Didymodactylos carnosus]
MFFTLPYYGHESDILAERLKKISRKLLPTIQLNIAFRKTMTLKAIFLPLQKGKDESKNTMKLVYKIPCKDCNISYIGETGRQLTTRMKEHQKDIKKNTLTSAVAQHANSKSHSFDFDKVEKLAYESDWRKRTIKESLYTQFAYVPKARNRQIKLLNLVKILNMYFVAVLYKLFYFIIPTAIPSNYFNLLRSLYGEVLFSTIRQTERLTLKLQKTKCDLEYLRLCLIYGLTPTFIKIKLWKKRMKNHQQYELFKRYCLQQEYASRFKDLKRYEEEINGLMNHLQLKLTASDYEKLQLHFLEKCKLLRNKTVTSHTKKLERLNRGPLGQNYEQLKSKIVHNLSSYTLSQVEERLLCRGYNFCYENKVINFTEFQTEIELNMSRIEELIRNVKRKRTSNISDDEKEAIKSLKNNTNIVICRADKGNAI